MLDFEKVSGSGEWRVFSIFLFLIEMETGGGGGRVGWEEVVTPRCHVVAKFSFWITVKPSPANIYFNFQFFQLLQDNLQYKRTTKLRIDFVWINKHTELSTSGMNVRQVLTNSILSLGL